MAIWNTTEIRQLWTSDKLTEEITLVLKQGNKQHSKVPLGECIIKEELIYILELLYVLDNKELHLEIIHIHNGHPAARHPVAAAIYEVISQNYW